MRKQLTLTVLLLAVAVSALAQHFTGSIRGTVHDTSGAIIVGAKVTLKGEGTGISKTMDTNAAGVYAFRELPVGTYEISVEQAGFKGAVDKNIILNVADERAVDFSLETGQISET